MFTKVKLQNFRSFDSIEFDLKNRNGNAKALAIVYGENGAGKSALMSAFVLLQELLNTMNVRDFYERVLAREDLLKDKDGEKLRRQLAQMRTIENIISDYKMIGCDEPIVAEYEFQIDGHMGRYLIELSRDEIIHERLEFLLNQRKGVYFDCKTGACSINRGIVTNSDLYADIMDAVRRFWGKHSILAIVQHETDDKSAAFGKGNLSKHFVRFLNKLDLQSSCVKLGDKMWNGLMVPSRIFADPVSGDISKDEEAQLDIVANIFSYVFSAVSPTIHSVFYEKDYVDQTVCYRLFVKKKIAGIYRNVPFARESTGNRQLIDALCFIFCACMGSAVVIDEADAGIHDVLFQTVVKEAYSLIEKRGGQLIMTTHNTMLMETEFARDATYIIQEDENGSKEIRCITSYEKRTYANNNVRNKYLNGDYHGIPTVKRIDFSGLIDSLLNQLRKTNSISSGN